MSTIYQTITGRTFDLSKLMAVVLVVQPEKDLLASTSPEEAGRSLPSL